MDSHTPEPSGVAAPASRLPAPRRPWLGRVLALLLVIALGGVAWYLVQRAKAPAGGPGGPGARFGAIASTVGVATAGQADIPVQLDALGTVTARVNVTVQPQVSGVLTQVLFKEGQMVKKGDVLATIDPQPFQNALAQAQGARERDEAQLAAARVTLTRFQTLLKQDSIARQDVDTQAALVKQLEGTVTIDRANEGAAKLNLTWSRIVAPVSGRVGLRTVDAGNVVNASGAAGIAVITQLAPIDVAFALPQDQLPEVQARVREGAKLPVTAFDRTRTHQLATGTFSTLDNLVDTTTGTIKAKARFDNADGVLFPNQFVNVSLLLRTIHGAVVIPVTALRHGPNGDFVYVIQEDKTVALRLVTRGQAGVDNVEIAKGLQVGERVVTEGGDRLKDGAPVQTAADLAARPPPSAAGAKGAKGGAEQRGGRRPPG